MAALEGARALLSVAGDGAVDEAGETLCERGVIQAQPRHHAGAKLLHEDIGLRDQTLERLTVLRLLEVEGDAFLAGS